MTVIDEIAAERKRQVEVEGWSAAHDDEHGRGEMARAAAAYAGHAGSCLSLEDIPYRMGIRPASWPWHREWWKPKTPRRDLIRAAALIVAEIERLDRKSPPLSAEER